MSYVLDNCEKYNLEFSRDCESPLNSADFTSFSNNILFLFFESLFLVPILIFI